MMRCEVGEVKTADGVVAGPTGEVGYEEVVQEWFGGRMGEVVGHGIVRRAGNLKELPPFWEIGMVGVDVSVDPDTGRVTVEHLVTVGDVGYAINPALVEGQELGAATQGLGAALYEQLIYDGPQLINPNLIEYRVPRMSDMPKDIDIIVAQRADGVGPLRRQRMRRGIPQSHRGGSRLGRRPGHRTMAGPAPPDSGCSVGTHEPVQ